MTRRVLIVDDDSASRLALADALSTRGYETETAPDGSTGLATLASFDPDVVLTELNIPKMDGIDLLERGRSLSSHVAFIITTGFGSIETAITAMKRGAENYLTKPLRLDEISGVVDHACRKSHVSREAARRRTESGAFIMRAPILGTHPSMRRVLREVQQVATSRATVLISGETGTGKELIAAAIHASSSRRDRPFVRLNCAALAESVFESELFGHERGAFTGATTRREGRFKQSDGGTLFLDEVSEVPMAIQVKLLRFLQERAFERVGSNETIPVDVRIIAATNKDLSKCVARGEFREDLYYRLNVVPIYAPALRERQTDIPLIAAHFMSRFARANGVVISGFSSEALRAIMNYPWPGNVRELENAVERAVVMTTHSEIGVGDLALRRHLRLPLGEFGLVPGLTMKDLKRIAFDRTLAAVGGSTAQAADILGVSRRTIQNYTRRDVVDVASDVTDDG